MKKSNEGSEVRDPVTVLIDIETATNLAHVWGHYEQDVIENERDWYILGFAYKILGEKKVHTHYVIDHKGDVNDDKKLMPELHEVLSKADIVIAHNGDRFDIPKIRTRLLIHGYTPLPPFRTIDTKKVAKSVFKFDSNRLDELGRQLGLGRKMDAGGFETWRRCMLGDKKAFAKMRKYNAQDVLLLEKVYLKMRPWMKNHPNLNIYTKENGCPVCGGHKVQYRGYGQTNRGEHRRLQCMTPKKEGGGVCGKWLKEFQKTTKEITRY